MKPPVYEVSFGKLRGRRIKVTAGMPGIWIFHFQCGDHAIAPGGYIEWFCEVPKFWLGTCKQKDNPRTEDYCWIETDKGVKAILENVAPFWKTLRWALIRFPNGLKPGQGVRFGLGTEDNPIDTTPHIYPQAAISVRVDYEGKGLISKLWPPIVIDVVPGKARKLKAVLPSKIKAGETFEVKVRAEDSNSNIGAEIEDNIVLVLTGPEGEKQVEVKLTKGIGRFQLWQVSKPGVYRVKAYSVKDKSIQCLSNAMVCEAGERHPYVFWGDTHCHTGWSDGTGSAEYNIDFAKNKSFLDVFGICEHLSADVDYTTMPEGKPGSDWIYLGPYLATLSKTYNNPGKFVTLLNVEYSPSGEEYEESTGDYCIFCPGDDWWQIPMAREVRDLFGLARKSGCLAIPHVGGRTIEWDAVPFDKQVTPLVEIASMHEHSEYFAQWGLQKGYKLGFLGMSDGHFGMPGYDNWAQHGRSMKMARRNYSVQSAITGFLCEELTRESIIEAMRQRRTYAATGQRILIDFEISGNPMGSICTIKGSIHLRAHIYGTAPIVQIDIIRGIHRIHRIKPNSLDVEVDWEDKNPVNGETYYYMRVIQKDFTIAWTSPIWVTYANSKLVQPDLDKLPKWNDGPDWPPKDEATCDVKYKDRLMKLFAMRGIEKRFANIEQIGVFEDNRGRFSLFRGIDGLDNSPIHIHHYFEFPPHGRVYIARGYSDYGQYPTASEWEKTPRW